MGGSRCSRTSGFGDPDDGPVVFCSIIPSAAQTPAPGGIDKAVNGGAAACWAGKGRSLPAAGPAGLPVPQPPGGVADGRVLLTGRFAEEAAVAKSGRRLAS